MTAHSSTRPKRASREPTASPTRPATASSSRTPRPSALAYNRTARTNVQRASCGGSIPKQRDGGFWARAVLSSSPTPSLHSAHLLGAELAMIGHLLQEHAP